MRVLIAGSLAAELGIAAKLAIARGAKLDQADTIALALAKLRADARTDLVIADVALDVPSLLAQLEAERIAVPVVAAGVAAAESAVLAALRAGARDYLPLPPDADLIAALLQSVGAETPDLAPRDPAMRQLLHRAEQVAASDASVLICGESGTGKEVLARRLHRASRRAGGPFIALNCAAIPDSLLESELFGHEKGAFSGAIARRTGKFEAAQGGTLLLDEISEMDVRLQAKLLRALQEREIDRLGGDRPVKIDVRILATTNRDLNAEIAAGRFRADLYFRLNVISLSVPPLRSRPADIVPLARHFIQRYAASNGLPARPLSDHAAAALLAHRWPGNVRELENTLHRAILLAEGPAIEPADLGLAPTDPPAPPQPSTPATFTFQPRTIESLEQEAILQTLRHTLGNRTHAAEILGISIRALRNKLREYAAQGLPVPPPPDAAALAAARA